MHVLKEVCFACVLCMCALHVCFACVCEIETQTATAPCHIVLGSNLDRPTRVKVLLRPEILVERVLAQDPCPSGSPDILTVAYFSREESGFRATSRRLPPVHACGSLLYDFRKKEVFRFAKLLPKPSARRPQKYRMPARQ